MKVSAIQRVLLSFTLILSGCGAGGVDQIETTGVSITRFLGVWHNNNPDPVCQPDQNGAYYSEGPMRLSGAAYIESYDFYSDSNCGNYLGSINNIFDITWSIPVSNATKSGAIRVIISNPQYTANGEINPPAITSDPSVAYKVLFYVENNNLSSYFDITTPTNLLDADGYPVGSDQPLFTYSR